MRRGFTLIELVVALTILGLATAVAVPAFGRLLNDDPSPAAPLTELLTRARTTAAEHGGPVTVVLIPATRRYWVWDARHVTIAEGVLGIEPLDGPERARFTFESAGRAAGDSIVVRGVARTELVTVDAWTGEVRVAPR